MTTKSIPQNQMSLFDWDKGNPDEAKSPVPIEVAQKWRFALAYHVVDNKYWYAGQDWVAGVAQPKSRASEFLRKLETRLEKDKIDMRTLCTQLPYRSPNGKTYQIDYFTDKGLYVITQRMDANTGIRNDVLDYLADSGVAIDFIRLHPEEAIRQIQSAADRQYIKRLLGWGYTEAELPALLAERHETVTVRLDFQHTLHLVTNGQGKYAIITNIEYQGMFGRNADQIRSETGTRSAREGMHPIAQQFCRLAEMSCTEAYRQHGRLTHDQAAEIMRGIASGLKLSVKVIQEKTGIDVVTGNPLLGAG